MAKKRPAGDGMLRKRDDLNLWEGRLVIGQESGGKYIFKYAYGKTQKETLAKLDQYKELYRDVRLTEESRMTLDEWMERWLRDYMVSTVRESTIKSYRMYIKHYISPHLGSKQISRITTADVQRMYNKLKESGRINESKERGKALAGSTVRRIHSMFRQAMEAAVQAKLIPRNPTDGTAVPRLDYRPMQILDEAQLDIFMKAIEQEPIWHDLLYTEITTGLRVGELCGLMWTDFDEVTGALSVRRTLHVEEGGSIRVGETKTGKGVRTILLPQSTANRLRERKKAAQTEWIFPNPIQLEAPVSPRTAYYHLKRILKEAGLPQVRFHDLRHTFSTHALASGVDPKTLSGILGHANASFTVDTYTHFTDDMKRGASVIVGGFMEDLFGKELKPWQREESREAAASSSERMEDGKAG